MAAKPGTRAKGNGSGDGVDGKPPSSPNARTSARPCKCACRVLGEAFAALLAEPYAHQLGVCAKLGIPWSTHMTWMGKDADPDSDVAQYQSIVLGALDDQRRLDLDGGQTQLDNAHPAKASAQFNMFRFQHENRFRRFYGDQEVKKVELTGKDGEPLEAPRVTYVVAVPQEEPDQEP